MTRAQYFLLSIHTIELITAIVATTSWSKYRYSTEKNFVYYFWGVFFFDVVGSIVAYTTDYNNSFIHNTLQVVCALFMFYWYFKILERKRFIYGFILLYLSATLVAIVLQDFTQAFTTINFVIGAVLILITALMYCAQLLQSNQILRLQTHLPFWITIGNIVYYIGILPVFLFQKYLNLEALNYEIVITLLLFSSDVCFILGFLWTRNK